jgi:hypothetical protein
MIYFFKNGFVLRNGRLTSWDLIFDTAPQETVEEAGIEPRNCCVAVWFTQSRLSQLSHPMIY